MFILCIFTGYHGSMISDPLYTGTSFTKLVLLEYDFMFVTTETWNGISKTSNLARDTQDPLKGTRSVRRLIWINAQAQLMHK